MTESYHEQYVGFYWGSDLDAGPQTMIVNFQLGKLNSYPTQDNDEDISEKQEMWVADNIRSLLEQDLITDVYDHAVIDSVDALEENIDDMSFKLYYY